jgi:hypothetical protein
MERSGFRIFWCLPGLLGGTDPGFDLDGDGRVGFEDFVHFAMVLEKHRIGSQAF